MTPQRLDELRNDSLIVLVAMPVASWIPNFSYYIP